MGEHSGGVMSVCVCLCVCVSVCVCVCVCLPFFFRHTDPLHVKVKKVEILADACMFENASQVTNELRCKRTSNIV